MVIACVYCGGEHPTAGEVRACWQHGASTPAPPRAWSRPGPPQLARGIVILAGGSIPANWQDASRVVVDQAVLGAPDETVFELAAHADAGRRVVIELATQAVQVFREPPRPTTALAPYELGPRFSFGLEVLHHLVWSNAIDATGDEPRWAVLDAAVALGAIPVHAGSGDVVLPGGSRAWLDGGPTRCFEPIDGLAVLHAVAVEHGSLRVPVAADTFSELAPDQRAAVLHSGAAARIIAPAGSGKTRVLTERARHLLNCWQVPPTAVSLVAFNKRAQEEMQARTGDLRGLRVRTLNAIALAIVNGSAPFHAQSRTYRTIDEIDVRRIIGRLVQFPRKRNTDPVATWIEALSMVRLGLRSPVDVEDMYNGDVDGFATMWPRYRAALDADNAIDFDDQIYRAIEMLLGSADVRHAAQRACRLLLVDEFQDLTPAHVLLVRLLSAPGFSVFGVGDDDQTIYGYSGADPSWLIDFAALFPNAGAHPLEINYRCPGDVVQAADRLVRHNSRRVAKVIRAARPDSNGLGVVVADDTLAATIVAVRSAIESGHDPGDVAVLTRVNAMLAPVQLGLLGVGIPVQGGVGTEFAERTAVRAALAWLRLSVADPGRLDANDLAEALRRPSLPLHPNVATWVAEQGSLTGLRRLAGRVNNDRDAQRVTSFVDDIARLKEIATAGTSSDILRALGDDVGLGASIATLDDSRRGMNRAAQNDDLVALAQSASLQPDPARFGPWLRDQLAGPRSDDGVTLATVHRVKGQEWPVVVLHHAEADQYPHRLAEDIEEERRVFHVALTRGREQVTVVVGTTPSPFVDEMRHEPPVRSAAPPPKARMNTRGAPRTAVALRIPADNAPSAASVRARDLLRQIRNRLRNGKPAYVVFDDATLERIALVLPTSLDELHGIKGIGPAKLELYGNAVLLAVEDALTEPGSTPR
jgi:DNA helicase-2/ATP-dependent DNA helicase PcrA